MYNAFVLEHTDMMLLNMILRLVNISIKFYDNMVCITTNFCNIYTFVFKTGHLNSSSNVQLRRNLDET
jgi:hypothetical protein